MPDNTDVTDFLMPGHVWLHKKKQTPATVMFMTNVHLDEKYAELYPQQVVYIDAKGNLTSATVEQFTRNRDFDHVEPQAEKAINDMVAAMSEDEEDIQLEDEDEGSSENTQEPQVGDEGNAGEEDRPVPDERERAIEVPVAIHSTFFPSSNQALPVVDAGVLSSALIGYTAAPTEGGVLHSMQFRELPNLTPEDVHIAFDSDIVRYNSATINDIEVSWNTFKGVWPRVSQHGTSAVALFFEEVEAEDSGDKEKAPKKAPAKKPAAKPAEKKDTPKEGE